MGQFIALLAAAAILVTATWFQYKLQYKVSRGRLLNPLWQAFSLTGASALFLVAGIIGYNLDKHSRFVARTSWSPTVVWWEVGVGLGLLPFVACLWRKGLRSLDVS